MDKNKAQAFLLKITDGAVPPNFSTVAGLRVTFMKIKAENPQAVTVDIEGSGIFLGSAAEALLAAIEKARTV